MSAAQQPDAAHRPAAPGAPTPGAPTSDPAAPGAPTPDPPTPDPAAPVSVEPPSGKGPAVVLIGPMGVGKSTVGALLAERTASAFRDVDDDIVAAEGRSIADIFVDTGEAYFRETEKNAVRTALAEHEGVLALGGGAVLDASTRALLAAYPVVYLAMDVDEAVKRTGLNVGRPLLAIQPRRQWRELMEQRRPLYTEVARAVVATDGRTPDEVAQAVLDALELKKA